MSDIALDLRYLRYAFISAEKGSFRQAAFFLSVSESDAQAATHRPDRNQWAMLGDERVSHFAFPAKYAVAFFRMSRSPVTPASSFFSSRISPA